MPFYSGTLTATLYRASAPPPPDAAEKYEKALRKFAFKPINVEKGEKVAGGWVEPRNILSSAVKWEGAKIAPYVFLALRIDKKSIPPTLLKAHLAQKMRDLSRERKGRPISKNEKAALHEQVAADLLRAVSPTISIYEAVWNTATNDVYFGSGSKGANEAFQQMFTDTFELGLEPANLLSRAEEVAKAIGSGRSLDELSNSWWGTAAPMISGGIHADEE